MQLWGSVDESLQEKIIDFLSLSLNYLFNSFLLAIPIYLFFLTRYSSKLKIYFFLVLSIFIILIFFEHYYVWVREGWKENLIK